MSISKDDFCRRAKLICDHWYFKYDADGTLMLMEKPYVRVEGWDNDYCVIGYPKDMIFNQKKLDHLNMIHMVRVRGKQKQVMEEMTGRNKMKEEASTKRFHTANREMFKEMHPVLKAQAESMGITKNSLRNAMKNVGWDDTKKVLQATNEYAEGVSEGRHKAMHPQDVFNVFRRKQAMGGK